MDHASSANAAAGPFVLAQQDGAPPAPTDPTQSPAPKEGEPGGSSKGADGAGNAGGNAGSPLATLLPLVLIAVFAIFLLTSNRREKKRRQQMLSGLKKGDRVLTVGGIYGTITDTRDEDLILKVDEQNNTKLHVSRSAVQSVQNQEQAES